MVEHLTRFIKSNSTFLFWRIYDAKGNELFEYDEQDSETIIEAVEQDYPFLTAGTYVLRGATSKFQGEKSSKKLPFTIAAEPKAAAQTQTRNNMNTYSAEHVSQLVKEAEERGRREARIDNLEMRFNEFLQRYDKEQRAAEKAIADKFDELDGKNDNDFVGKATDAINKIAPSMPVISDSLKGFKL